MTVPSLGRSLLVAVFVAAAVPMALAAWPYPEGRLVDASDASWRVLDRDGALLREAVGASGARARWVPLAEVSPLVVDALIAVEDRRFRHHAGVDAVGLGRAAVDAARYGRVVSGASTLSMQLARVLGDLPRTPWGKARQIVDAARLERVADKDDILEQYLNRVVFAPGTVGIEAASERTFGKPTRHLSLAEAALLAGLAQAPSGHHPSHDPGRALRRRAAVLDAMLATGAVTAEQHALASSEPLPDPAAPTGARALHFTDHVLSLAPPPGDVVTTLDLGLQEVVQRAAAAHVEALEAGGLRQAAVIVLDNERCDVLAMVGSADWWGEGDGRVNGALALRQPGSALKPFLYGLAFERGWDPASVAADVPTRYPDSDGLLMHPRNYAERFAGPVLLGDALGRSLNVPAVRLANAVGIEDVLHVMQRAGLDGLDRDAAHYGLGLVLGNGEVTLLQLARAYAMLARGGVSCTPRVLEGDPVDDGERVLSEVAAFLVRDVLTDEGLRAQAFGWDHPLQLGFPVAVKTGTSSNWRDSLAVGFTDRHTVAVWAGDFGGAPMARLSGAIGAGPLFRGVMREVTLRGAVRRVPGRPLPPEGVEAIEVCALSGGAPTAHCPVHRTVHVEGGHGERAPCAWHRPVRIDRRNGLRASARCPSEHVVERVYAALPPAYAQWQHDQGTAPPSRSSPLCPPDGVAADAVVITHPLPDDVFVLEPGYARATQTLALAAEVDPPVGEVTWTVDGRVVTRSGWPYVGAWALERGAHEIVAVAGGRRSEPVRVEVR
jgi:penicillin-binding protein 1C